MKKIVALLYHDAKWQSEENIRERYDSSIIPGAWEALSAARLRSPVHQVRSTTEEFVKQLSQLNIPLLIMSCEHDPLNQSDWDVNFQKIVPGSKIHRFMHSAHEPQIEETEEFNRVLIEFLLAKIRFGESLARVSPDLNRDSRLLYYSITLCSSLCPTDPTQNLLQRAHREYGRLLAGQRRQDF